VPSVGIIEGCGYRKASPLFANLDLFPGSFMDRKPAGLASLKVPDQGAALADRHPLFPNQELERSKDFRIV
jgi:hypothetical protein